jgi:hypothetical protein
VETKQFYTLLEDYFSKMNGSLMSWVITGETIIILHEAISTRIRLLYQQFEDDTELATRLLDELEYIEEQLETMISQVSPELMQAIKQKIEEENAEPESDIGIFNQER